MGDSATEAGDGGGAGDEVGGIREGEDRPEALQKLSSMRDVARFVLKISDMGLGKQLLNGQSRCVRQCLSSKEAAIQSPPGWMSDGSLLSVCFSGDGAGVVCRLDARNRNSQPRGERMSHAIPATTGLTVNNSVDVSLVV